MAKLLENIRIEEVGRKRFSDKLSETGGIKKDDPNFRISLAEGKASLRVAEEEGSVTYFVFKNGR